MQEKIRLATPEEIEEVKDQSNLTPMCRVLRLGEMTAVWRIANEIDPLIPNGATRQRQFKFMWGIENILKGAGVSEYFYNVPADDPTYHRAIEEHFGAERLSKQPDFRYRVNI
jgi:hypothetical protein